MPQLDLQNPVTNTRPSFSITGTDCMSPANGATEEVGAQVFVLGLQICVVGDHQPTCSGMPTETTRPLLKMKALLESTPTISLPAEVHVPPCAAA
jgi:hypothetical protein